MTEAEFYEKAKAFLLERIGEKATPLTEDTELVESGLLDSLLVLEFFFFLEELRGTSIEPENFSVSSVATLRSAYGFVSG